MALAGASLLRGDRPPAPGPAAAFPEPSVSMAGDAEDILQDAFLKAWQSLDRYDPRFAFRTWPTRSPTA